MENHSISSITVILLSGLLSACSMSDWWNGHYATRAALTNAQKEREAYYAAESPEQRELRRKNDLICDKETGYDRCMRRLGTACLARWIG
ncbi:MAG: hypothetical protein ACFNX9_03100 [Eikenella corrodens]|uniref:hypothetical protein n=1 Tax=Eikenella corrodens TaxID=539 RepID=UPI00361C5BD8